MKISIIIPVYNAAKYLRRCLDSCLAQTCHDFEVICINDGSTDGSGHILNEYEDRICIINQQNLGVVVARNAGIAVAKGTWLCFVDADDWLELDALERYVAAVDDDVDIVVGDHNLVWGTRVTHRRAFDKYGNILGAEYLDQCLWCLHGYIWGKIIRRDLCLNLNVSRLYKLNEDLLINVQTAVRARSVVHIDDSLYNFYVEEGPAKIKRPHSESVESVLGVNHDVARILKSRKDCLSILSHGYIRYLVGNVVMIIVRPYYSPQCRFLKLELIKAFCRAPFITLRAVFHFRSLALCIVTSMCSIRLAKLIGHLIQLLQKHRKERIK